MKLVNMNSTSETYRTDINKKLTKLGHAWTHPSNSLSWDFMIPKNKNNQAVNWGDIADQRIIQSDYLTPKTNRTLRSLPFSDVHLLHFTSPLDWMDKHNMHMLHQAWENNLKLNKSLPCKNWKVENNFLTKFQATKCVN